MTNRSAGTLAAVPTQAPAVTEHQRAVLYALKRSGEATVDDLANTLGMSVSGARQHLVALHDAGLVTADELPTEGRGRRPLLYRLTDTAETLFPKAYGELTNELLGYVGDEDGALVERIFVRRRDQRITNAKKRIEAKPTLAARVRELARILDADGYLAESTALPDGSFRITEHNCAILSVASKFLHACTSELDFIRAVLPDTTVERVSHMIAGQHHCAYVITPR
jgi:predicted ArsR family transcriptional regulator